MAFSCVIYSSLSPYNDVSAISKHTDLFFCFFDALKTG